MRGAALLALTTAPGLAFACAACAAETSPFTWLLVAGLVAAPYAVGLAVVAAIRRAQREAR
jgi:hypothetical protein